MATFYLLPPRACLERAVSDLFGKLLPGLPLPSDAWDILTQQLIPTSAWPADAFLVPRDELPDGDPTETLVECYGAEPGDRVVEVSLSRPARTWTLAPAGVSSSLVAR